MSSAIPSPYYFKSNRDCYIHLIDIGTSGQVTLIYPNQFDQDNKIKKDVTYQLPRPGSFRFTASAPEGSEMVKAIATLTKTDLVDLTGVGNAGPFKSFKQDKGTAVAKDIRVTLDKVPAKQWAEYQKVLTIVKAPAGPLPVASPPVQPAVSPAQPAVSPGQGHAAFGTEFWTDKQTYKIGEPVRFYFKTNRDAHVSLVSIGTSGQVRVLFPNRFVQNNFCKAGVVYTIPGAGAAEQYVALGPAGTETVKLIAAQNQVSLSQTPYDYTASPYPVLNKNPEQVSKDIQVVLTGQTPGAFHDEAAISVQIVQ